MRTVAIIQARMGSSRLPGKVLMPLVGKPILWHIIHRLRKCRHVDSIAVATSTSPTDDPIEEFVMGEGVEIVRGSEDDVLARYMLAAERLSAEIVVRITGDAPLIDPPTIDRLIETLIETDADYCMRDPKVPCIHEGFCPFTFRALQKLVREGGDDPVAKEHVTAYFKEHLDFVRTVNISIEPDYQFAGARISVDTPEDLRFLEKIYSRLKVPAGDADVIDVVRLLREEPELLKINSHVHQKGVYERGRKILFRCDGDTEVGLGHIYRCLALADQMRDAHGCGVLFSMAAGRVGFDLVRAAGYPVEQITDEGEEDTWLERTIEQWQPDALVLDVRSALARDSVDQWRKKGLLVITLDDPSERRLAADLAFYPPVPQVGKIDWTGFTGKLHVGWEWVVLRKQFARCPSRVPHVRPTILVTMGGSDPSGLTLKVIEALEQLDDEFEMLVVIGPAFPHHNKLERLMATKRCRVDIRKNVTDMAALMTRADLAIASFGVTAYELAAMGVPAIYFCATQDHAESASTFVKEGVALSMGPNTMEPNRYLVEIVTDLMRNPSNRLSMERLARPMIDGKGAARIANLAIAELN